MNGGPMSRARAWLRVTLLFLCALAIPAISAAHEMTMAELALRETAHGEFMWQWTATNDKSTVPIDQELRPVWPAHCEVEPNLLHCGLEGLSGSLEIEESVRRTPPCSFACSGTTGRNGSIR